MNQRKQLAALLALLAAAACEPAPEPASACDSHCQAVLEAAVRRELENPAAPPRVAPCASGGRASVFYDEQERPQRIEEDCNGDGRTDRWTEFDSNGKAVATQLDSDFDGRADRTVPAAPPQAPAQP